MTNKEFLEKLKTLEADFNTVYMWGVFGAPVTESLITSKAKQYPEWYTSERQAAFRKLIGKNYFGFDCVNMIKGILWGWSGNASKTYGGATYASNGVPDVSANGMLTKLVDVSTDFSNIIEGEAVWMEGHIGVYIGRGIVIECTPRWSNSVQVTACLNIGSISGMNGRKWTKHGKLPYITYEEIEEEKPDDTKESEVEKMTLDEFKKLYKQMVAEEKGDKPSDWAKEACEDAKAAGIFNGDGKGNYNWQDPVTREAMAVILKNAGVT